MTELRSPLQAHIVQLLVQPGEAVQQGQLLLVLEAMKMEHEVCAPSAGTVRELFCAAGDTVQLNDVSAEVMGLISDEQWALDVACPCVFVVHPWSQGRFCRPLAPEMPVAQPR